jgi:hypothetical protein
MATVQKYLQKTNCQILRIENTNRCIREIASKLILLRLPRNNFYYLLFNIWNGFCPLKVPSTPNNAKI